LIITPDILLLLLPFCCFWYEQTYVQYR